MNRLSRNACRGLVVLVLASLFSLAALAQMATDAKEPGMAVVSIYRIAPGKHLDFLKWMAAREAAGKEAGAPATQWYVHMDGDNWDYIGISPEATDAQDDRIDELVKAKGLATGFRANLELRTMIASHTDTFARGPVSAAELVELARK